ncbi:hypothetical protein V8C42DRAFT_348685 [Trichoderma barbatum]
MASSSTCPGPYIRACSVAASFSTHTPSETTSSSLDSFQDTPSSISELYLESADYPLNSASETSSPYTNTLPETLRTPAEAPGSSSSSGSSSSNSTSSSLSTTSTSGCTSRDPGSSGEDSEEDDEDDEEEDAEQDAEQDPDYELDEDSDENSDEDLVESSDDDLDLYQERYIDFHQHSDEGSEEGSNEDSDEEWEEELGENLDEVRSEDSDNSMIFYIGPLPTVAFPYSSPVEDLLAPGVFRAADFNVYTPELPEWVCIPVRMLDPRLSRMLLRAAARASRERGRVFSNT